MTAATAEKPKTEAKRVKVLNRKLVPLKRLKNAKHNPPGRVEVRFLRDLIDSLDMIGQLHPITVTPHDEIIDGHRRVAAAKHLGWLDIEANVVEEDPATVYRSVNSGSAKRMGGNDAMCIWLIDPKCIKVEVANRIRKMADTVGVAYVRKVAEAGYSVDMFRHACRVGKYVEMQEPAQTKVILDWLLDVASMYLVSRAIEMGESPKVIRDAIRKNKPVVLRIAVGE